MFRILSSVVVVGLIISMGCGLANAGPRDYNDDTTTLLLINEGIGDIRVYSDMGRVATIMSGKEKCIVITSPERRVSYSFSQSVLGERWYAPFQYFSRWNGWIWKIDAQLGVFATLGIMPSDRCGKWGEADRKASIIS